jgi:hypothetical protein
MKSLHNNKLLLLLQENQNLHLMQFQSLGNLLMKHHQSKHGLHNYSQLSLKLFVKYKHVPSKQ